MDEIIIINRRGAPVYLGNKFKFVPGRNRFSAKVFEQEIKIMKGFELFLNAKSLQVLDLRRKPEAAVEVKDVVSVTSQEVTHVDIVLDDQGAVLSRRHKGKNKRSVSLEDYYREPLAED